MQQSFNMDTIAAQATALGPGGIGIIRLSGPLALTILTQMFKPGSESFSGFVPYKLHHGQACRLSGQPLDDILAVYMPGPGSFTGEDVVEFQGHGSPVLLGLLLEEVCTAGARLARPGEFTQRAFLNKRMDLSQAEAVAELISASSKAALNFAHTRLSGGLLAEITKLNAELARLQALLCLAVDFPEDEVDPVLDSKVFLESLRKLCQFISALIHNYEQTKVWGQGLTIALAGPVNAGKSSLLNALLGRQRALVSPEPGTTRDYLVENINLAGLNVRLIDTAGIRQADNILEDQGINLGRELICEADLVILLVDGQNPHKEQTLALVEEFKTRKILLLWNKQDIMAPAAWFEALAYPKLSLSVLSGHLEGLEEEVRRLVLSQDFFEPQADMVVPNLRQTQALAQALIELKALAFDVESGLPWDLCSVRLEGAATALADVIGQSTPEDILNNIFASFCIGK